MYEASSPGWELERRYDEVDEREGRPLEAEHRGEFLAVSAHGETLIGPTFNDVARRASEAFGPGTLVFKIGNRAVGAWR